MNKSFSLVSQRLEQVYKGLGEMQHLATGVGDLKKVLSNVKTRGILGEIQLGSILSEILSPEQYAENVATKKGSKNVVEFAVKLPAKDDGFIWLPIDSKFPGDTYTALRDAMENGDKAQTDACAKTLLATIKAEAKDISTKYIDPPNTTEFAIMFLPFEGLYSEVVNRGMIEVLQRDYKVNIAGPSTMAAPWRRCSTRYRWASRPLPCKSAAPRSGRCSAASKRNLTPSRRSWRTPRKSSTKPTAIWTPSSESAHAGYNAV